MIRGKFFGCFVTIFFLSYGIILFQSGFAQNTQLTTTQPPSVEAPPFIIARATSPSWTQVNFQVNATSTTSDKISVYCNPASGSAFPMGSTIVLCAAKDPATSLVGYAMFNVTVKDTSPPTFKVPHSILKQADDLQGANITYDANASDTVDGNTVTTCDPPSGSTFPLGLNQVKCTATDKSGNKAEASFSVIIGQTPSDESTEEAIPALSQNETNQLKSPESTVSENITDDSIPETVSENITDDSIPETVSENITDDSSPPLENIIENDTEEAQIQQLENNLNENNSLIKVTIDSLQNQRATEGSLVKINGTSVHDSGNEKLSFTWKQTGGEPIDPEEARITSQTIGSEIAPQIGGNITNLIFEVTVPPVDTNNDDKLTFEIIAKDDNGNSASDSVDIFVDNNPEFVGTGNFQNNPNVLQSIRNEEQNKSNLPLTAQGDIEKPIEVSTSLDKGFTFVNMWGSFGKGNGRFDGQNDVDPFNGRVYVADYANHRIQVFDTKGNYMTKWGTYGEENGQIHKASALSVVPSGNIYLSDQFNYRIQVFTSNGTFVTAWGTKGEGDGQFLHPHVPGVDSEGNVYVSDRDLANVQKFTGDGKFIMKWSEEGSNDGQLSKPESVIIDSKDNVYVADFGNHRIQKFTNDGKFILKWGSKGIGDGEFNGPAGLSIDRNDNIYVTDRNNNRIQVFTANGTFLTKFGTEGSGSSQFILPEGVGVDINTGLVYVADTGNYRIQVFRPVASSGNVA
ncbi:MAG: 6-bladed beta-propeller [Nitrososphaeraceae archaeon]|nr:6-bladed beta-propeller [Nitrososphaeraceae archaeon]